MKKRLTLIITLVLLLGCASSDDSDLTDDIIDEIIDDTPLGDNSFLEADINGESLTFNFGPDAIGAGFANSGFASIYAFVMAATTDGILENDNDDAEKIIELGLVSSDPNVIKVGAEFNYATHGLVARYYFGNEDGETLVDADETIEANLKITKVDIEDKIISGEFSFISTDENTDISYTVTNGVFNNVPYIVDLN